MEPTAGQSPTAGDPDNFDELINVTTAAHKSEVRERTIERWMDLWTDDETDPRGLRHDHKMTTRRWLQERRVRMSEQRRAKRQSAKDVIPATES